MKNKVQLITYVERMGGDTIEDLSKLLEDKFSGVFGAVHLLPFFHVIDGVDAGFDPIDHTKVDSRLGDWTSIKQLSQKIDVMADVIVNHVSSKSPQFLDFGSKVEASIYNGMFLTPTAVFPNGASESDWSVIYRPRSGSPFSDIKLANGETRTFWTTFTSDQIDIDVRHPCGVAYLDSILSAFSESGVKLIRLDAVGYSIKKAKTSSFMMPETFEFISEFSSKAKA
jgi:sucrose phosphorylase